MPYNPNAAPEREPLSFKNTVRCIADELITVQEAVTRGRMRQLPEGVDGNEPYWDLQYEALDTRRYDGSAYIVSSGCRLFTRRQDGTYRMADKTQRPHRISGAFAGLGLTAFPGDPAGKFDAWCQSKGLDTIGPMPGFDATKIVGNCFVVEKPAPNRTNPKDPVNFAAPLPTAVLGPTFVYTGDVRTLAAPQATNEDGQAAPSPATFVDILRDDMARTVVLKAIEGKPVAALDDALMAANVSHNFQINGESVMAAAVAGKLASILAEAGLVTLDGGVVALAGQVAEAAAV